MTQDQSNYALWIIRELVAEQDRKHEEDDTFFHPLKIRRAETTSVDCARHLLSLLV